MKSLVNELKKIVKFKDTTVAGDHVLIVTKKPQTILYALVASIERDPGRKGEWWHVRMHVFSVPPQTVIWTLRERQFTGMEIFTMQGIEHFMKAVLLKDENRIRPEGKNKSPVQKNTGSRKNPFRIVK